jgi:hypothetical protein
VLPDSDEFLTGLGDPNPDYDAVGFAVRNLGYVKFQVLDRLVTEIELHPRNVSLPALVALEHQLAAPGTRLFRIKYLETEWHSEISASAEHTISRLYELCAPGFAGPPADKYRAEVKDPGILARDGAGPLRLLARKWRVAFGNFDASLISFAIQQGLLPRLAIAAVTTQEAEPIFRFVGDGFASLGANFQFEAVGQRVQDIPDKDYGGWVAECYKGVALSGQPRYDVVTAAIRGPADNGAKPLRYERLLLPWKAGSGEVLVTLLSKRLSSDSEPEFADLVGEERAAKKLVKSS